MHPHDTTRQLPLSLSATGLPFAPLATVLILSAPLHAQLTPKTGECLVTDPFGGTVGCTSSQPLNPLILGNDPDALFMINDPFVGGDPELLVIPVSTDYSEGDFYWKVFPAQSLQRCDGLTELWGLELNVYDEDYDAGEVLWGYAISEGTSVPVGDLIEPDFSKTAVVVPGLAAPTIFGSPSGGCPSGDIEGWHYTETFEDLWGNEVELVQLAADGKKHWVFTHFYPQAGPHTSSSGLNPPINNCGKSGDMTLQYAGSTDLVAPFNLGENQSDWTGQDHSPYGGYNAGPGVNRFADTRDSGSDVIWLFNEPVMQLRVDTDNGDLFPGPELGLAALETPLQIDSSFVPAAGTTRFGTIYHDGNASTDGISVMLQLANVLPNHLDTGAGCQPFFDATSAMNLLDPIYLPVLTNLSFASFSLDPDRPNTRVAVSPQVGAGMGAGWHNLTLSWEAHTINLISASITGTSQVFRNTFRFNDGL